MRPAELARLRAALETVDRLNAAVAQLTAIIARLGATDGCPIARSIIKPD